MKVFALRLLRALGAFAAARRITRSGLRILCYHGVGRSDEHVFNPMLFMRESVFRRRLATLKKGAYPVISLEQAATGRYPPNAVVITIDDGWVSTLQCQAPALLEHGLPATLYVASYYCERQAPVFNVYARYIFSKDVEPFDVPEFSFDWKSAGLQKHAALEKLLALAESVSFDARARLAAAVQAATGVNGGQFRYLSMDELPQLRRFGVDVQLHTHRHLFPADDARVMRREITDNRAACRAVVDGPLNHFCYPSGEWSADCFPVLEEQGISTATTCENVLAYADTGRFAIGRFVDSDDTPDIIFEAQLAGLLDILRHPRRYLRWRPLGSFSAMEPARTAHAEAG